VESLGYTAPDAREGWYKDYDLLLFGVGVEGLAIVPVRDYVAGQLLAFLQLSDRFVQSL
jgi:hypothetical protein